MEKDIPLWKLKQEAREYIAKCDAEHEKGGLTMWHHEIIEKLRKNLAELPSDMIEYNLGYAAAISDLEHIAEEAEPKEEADDGHKGED